MSKRISTAYALKCRVKSKRKFELMKNQKKS